MGSAVFVSVPTAGVPRIAATPGDPREKELKEDLHPRP